MKLIKLNNYNQSIIVDDEDFERVVKYNWLMVWNTGYVYSSNHIQNGQCISIHRFILDCSIGDGKIVDHINGDKLDNRKENLRFVSASDSMFNRAVYNKTGLKGVIERQGKFLGQRNINGKCLYAGTYLSANEAFAAITKMLKEKGLENYA